MRLRSGLPVFYHDLCRSTVTTFGNLVLENYLALHLRDCLFHLRMMISTPCMISLIDLVGMSWRATIRQKTWLAFRDHNYLRVVLKMVHYINYILSYTLKSSYLTPYLDI